MAGLIDSQPTSGSAASTCHALGADPLDERECPLRAGDSDW